MTTLREQLGDRWADMLVLGRCAVTFEPEPPLKPWGWPADLKAVFGVVEYDGERARAYAILRGKARLETDGGMPVVLGATGLPCNGWIVRDDVEVDARFGGDVRVLARGDDSFVLAAEGVAFEARVVEGRE